MASLYSCMSTCTECKTEVEPDAKTCPHCGYAPQEKHKTISKIYFFAGILLTLSIVGSPIGIPLMFLGYHFDKKRQNQTVAQSS